MQKAWEKLKKKWEEDPLQVLVVGALVATAGAKLIDAHANAKSRKTWAREVERRERMSR
jgi:hypothetical protein